jgi:hypothetical protein
MFEEDGPSLDGPAFQSGLRNRGLSKGHSSISESKRGVHMKTRNVATSLVAAVAMIAMLGIVPAISQDQPADTMQIVHERVRADKRLLVAETLQLTEPEATAFWPVYDRFQTELGKLTDRSIKLIQRYGDAYKTMSNAEAKRLLDEYLAIEGDRNRLRQSYLPKFRKVLSEKKVARYYQLENKIHAVVSYELAKEIPLIK